MTQSITVLETEILVKYVYDAILIENLKKEYPSKGWPTLRRTDAGDVIDIVTAISLML